MASEGFTRGFIRDVLGEAYTDEIATKLAERHRGILDPIKDQLDEAKRDVTKYKTVYKQVKALLG